MLAREMKNIILNLFLLTASFAYTEEAVITDTFILEGNIEVVLKITVNDGVLEVEAAFTNKSAKRVMLNNTFLERMFAVTDENGNPGNLVSPSDDLWIIFAPFEFYARLIDVIGPGETKLYYAERFYEQTGNQFVFFGRRTDDGVYRLEHDRIFENPQSIRLTIKYYSLERYRNEMRRIARVRGAVSIPDFCSRAYVIAEFEH
jgi:hypothetical protein